jgi:hypothetical protein
MFKKFIHMVHSVLVLSVAIQSLSASAQPISNGDVNTEISSRMEMNQSSVHQDSKLTSKRTNSSTLPCSECPSSQQAPLEESMPDDDLSESEEDPSLEIDQMLPHSMLSGLFDLISLRIRMHGVGVLQPRSIQSLHRPPQA